MTIAYRTLANRTLRMLVLTSMLFTMSACTSGDRLVKTGPTMASGKLMIDSEMEWTRLYTGTRYQLWSIDGELLNRLYLIPTVREKEYIFLGGRETKRRPDGAFYHRGLRPDELRDLILDGLRAAGTVNIEARDLRPVNFGSHEGLRFEFSLANEEGLRYQGMAAAFEHEKGLSLAIFMAPTEYYYPRDEAKVSKMLDSLRLK
jgi:hypothetical protein